MKTERLIPPEVINTVLANIQRQAHKIVVELQQQHQPILIAMSLKDDFTVNESNVILFAQEGRPPTQQIGEMVNEMLSSKKFDVITFVTEAWMSKTPTIHVDSAEAAFAALSAMGRPSEDPARSEAIIITVYTRHSQQVSFNPILRNPTRLELSPFDVVEMLGGNLSIHDSNKVMH